MREKTEYAIERMCADVAQIRKLMERGAGKTDCDFCADAVASPETFSVMTHSGKQVTAIFNFCPVCGRKLDRL